MKRIREFFCSILLGLVVIHPAQSNEWIYTVVEGDNLWNLSEKYLGGTERVEALRRLNNIDLPRAIPPGTLVRVPLEWMTQGAAPATVRAVAGTATVFRGAGDSSSLSAGDELVLGDRIRTESGASLSIEFADGSTLTLFERSEIRMDSLSIYGDTGMVSSRVHLAGGRLETRVTPAVGPGSRFEIETPSAISAVRGTEFRAGLSGDDTSRIEVLEGEVGVSAQGQTQAVAAGFGTQVRQGSAPIEPRELLAAPTSLAYGASPRASRSLSWSAVSQAVSYRVQVSEDASFSTLVWQSDVVGIQAEPGELAQGAYHARVSAIDSAGLEGLPRTAAITVSAAPPPDAVEVTILSSGKDALIAWEVSDRAGSYEIQLASDRRFNKLLSEDQLTVTQLSVDLASGGERFVRVRVVGQDGQIGAWSEVRTVAGQSLAPSWWPDVSGFVLTALIVLALL